MSLIQLTTAILQEEKKWKGEGYCCPAQPQPQPLRRIKSLAPFPSTRSGKTHPWLEGGQPQSHSNCSLVGVHHRVVMYVAVIAHPDGLIFILMDAMESVDRL